jgi:hypothetical protein
MKGNIVLTPQSGLTSAHSVVFPYTIERSPKSRSQITSWAARFAQQTICRTELVLGSTPSTIARLVTGFTHDQMRRL